MLIKTILNKCHPVKGFVYGKTYVKNNSLFIEITNRKNSQGRCSKCNTQAPTYDHQSQRSFRFVPMWGYIVYLLYRSRRVSCPIHGVTIEHLPWASGKSPICHAFKLFLSHWARLLSWKEVAMQFQVSWHNVFESVQSIVEYGLKHRVLDSITAIGIDEIQWHKYLTLVYQINDGMRRLLFVGNERKAKTLLRFFYRLGKERCAQIQVVCSDLWQPYLKVVKKKLSDAVHILDRFHIMKYLNDAVDKTRREETAQLKHDGYEPILSKSRWCVLKSKKKHTSGQKIKLQELLKYKLKTIRCFLHKEAFQHFWSYKSKWGAERFLKAWIAQAMRSQLPELKKVAKRLRKHQQLLLNYFSFKQRFSNGIVEGFNLKAKLTIRKSYGFKTFTLIEIALYHALGKLPEPVVTHRFY